MISKDYIIGSGLPQEDKDLWLVILSKLSGDQIQVFDDFVENKEDNLRLLTLNLRTKMEAFRTVDEKTIEKLLKEEATFQL